MVVLEIPEEMESNMKMKSKDQIATEIAALEEIKPRVRRCSIFGDDHHAAIDAQVEVLREVIATGAELDDLRDDNDWADNVYDEAYKAQEWLNGESEATSLVDEWKELAR